MAKRVPLTLWRLLAAIIGGLLAGPTLPRAGIWLLIFPAVALLFWSVRGTRGWLAFAVGLVGGITFYAAQSPWLTAYLGPVPWLALATLEGLIFGLGMMVTALVWRSIDGWSASNQLRVPLAALALASTWTAREFLAGHWPYGGYQWSRLAQTQSDTILANWGYWLGLSGISFVCAFISALVLLIFLERDRQHLLAMGAIGLVLVIAATTVIPTSGTGRTIKVAAVQGNANAGLFANPLPGSILAKHVAATRKLALDPNYDGVQVVVWPENASDLDPMHNAYAESVISELTNQTLRTDLVLGGVTYRGNEVFNSTVLYRPDVGVVDWYDKVRPVPFAEYVPDRDFWYPIAPDLIGLISHGFSFGQRDGLFSTGGTKAGSLICFEIAIDDVVAKLVNGGAQVIFSQANNSDFGHTDETFQQEALARLQAIATGRGIVQVSTVGVSELILPNGKVQDRIAPFTRGYLIGELPLSTSRTPAMIVGNYFDYLNLIALMLLLSYVIWRVRRNTANAQRFLKKAK